MQSKITIGITGGIGSGKSIVCRIIGIMGYPVFNSDNEAKKILSQDPEVIDQIKSVFGDKAYVKGKPNRQYIASKIFNDNQLLNFINDVVHPKVKSAYEKWTNSQKSRLVFNEAAILFETGSYQRYSYNILITSPLELRIQRIIKRDSISRKDVEERIKKQWPDEQKIPLADFLIRNDEVNLVIPQIINTLESINKLYENT